MEDPEKWGKFQYWMNKDRLSGGGRNTSIALEIRCNVHKSTNNTVEKLCFLSNVMPAHNQNQLCNWNLISKIY